MTYSRIALCVTAVTVGLAASAVAQTPPTPSCTLNVPYGGTGVGTKQNAPFTATVKRTFDQRLPDGNTIHATTETRAARNSAGSTVIEMASGCMRQPDGTSLLAISTTVYNRETNTQTTWSNRQSGEKIATVFHRQEPALRTLTPAQPAQGVSLGVATSLGNSARQRASYKTEQLGIKNIGGVEATGIRTTRTIPAGEEGNALPLDIVTESWVSRDLSQNLLNIQDDPRRGKTTTELEDVRLGEPDAALFQPPAGYKIKDIYPNAARQAAAQPASQ